MRGRARAAAEPRIQEVDVGCVNREQPRKELSGFVAFEICSRAHLSADAWGGICPTLTWQCGNTITQSRGDGLSHYIYLGSKQRGLSNISCEWVRSLFTHEDVVLFIPAAHTSGTMRRHINNQNCRPPEGCDPWTTSGVQWCSGSNRSDGVGGSKGHIFWKPPRFRVSEERSLWSLCN